MKNSGPRWRGWFRDRGWTPLPFQEATWAAGEAGKSGLLHMPTGAGKTYAAYGGAVVDALANPHRGLQIIYLTPLRALSRDIEKALVLPVNELGLKLTVASRTGDTSSYQRAKLKKQKPNVLVTTPESLALLLSDANAAEDFKSLRTVIVDEWHELLSTKRGSLLELSLSRLRKLAPGMKTWALSATLANVEEAALAAAGANSKPMLISSPLERDVIITSVLPDTVERFPWAGHMGMKMLDRVLATLSTNESTLIFTNTRSQAERWFQAIWDARPEWQPFLALHHGSLDRKERERVEGGLKEGLIKIAVCTSSLDLGIDLAPVERVIQIGSPKGIGRLIQRAGRAAHAPGKPCPILFVPTHALELVEIAAAREAVMAGEVESRAPLRKPLDVLAQHLVTVSMGGGFDAEIMFEEVKTAYAFRDLTQQEMDWTLALVREGGGVLRAYPGYRKVVEVDGRYQISSPQIARQHRLNIGTITSDSSMLVRFARGRKLGTVEESYITRLRRGEKFLFGGKLLQLVMVRDLVAYVKKATGKAASTPRWSGGKLPISASLASAMRRKLGTLRDGDDGREIEIERIRPILETQRSLSIIPRPDECLVERCQTRDGAHLFLFPFEGRLVHEGLASLLAFRMGRIEKTTFSLTVNDYGIEFLAPANYPFENVFRRELFDRDGFVDDVLAAVNLTELARRQFREIARVAGLIFQNYPGNEKSSRQLQASSSLLFDIFKRYDPENLLLLQAQREVLEQYFEQNRLTSVLDRLFSTELTFRETKHPTPLAFPLVAERISAKLLSTETLAERIERMIKTWGPVAESSSKKKKSSSFRNARSTGRRGAL